MRMSRVNRVGRVARAGGGLTPAGTLSASIAAAWKLNEASGNATDSVGSITLTDTNTVTSDTGLVYALARLFTRANTEFLTVATNATVEIGTSQSATFAVWAKPAATNAFQMVLAKNGEYDLRINGASNAWEFGNTTNNPNASAGTPTIGQWAFLVAWQDATAGTLNLQVNDGTVASAVNTLNAATAFAFQIGARDGANTWDGLIGPCYFFRRVLSAGERTYLYNGGSGRTYPFV
jgi:hypothetical protein